MYYSCAMAVRSIHITFVSLSIVRIMRPDNNTVVCATLAKFSQLVN